ncbi:MAG TPA: hypothetical protein VJC21_02600 [Candidatus Nanoarchaeia archaeon]|nr:hypothetical protein [Candidatus Nanoarchaeia archaeon]
MSKTLEACLQENAARETKRRQRIATLAQQEEHLRQAFQRIKEQRQTALIEQAQAPSAEELYWQHVAENAQQLQERSTAMAGWRSTAAEDERLIALYEANKDIPVISSSLKEAYEAAVQRKGVLKEPVLAEIALRMIPYGGGEAYLLSLPVPIGKTEGLAEEMRAHVEEVLEQNKVRRNNYIGHELQSYTLLSINPKCHPEKLEGLLKELREVVPESLGKANVQWVVSDVRKLVTEKKGEQLLKKAAETVEEGNSGEEMPDEYLSPRDAEELTGLDQSTLCAHYQAKEGPIKRKYTFDPAIGKNRVSLSRRSLEAFVQARGGRGDLRHKKRAAAPAQEERATRGYSTIEDVLGERQYITLKEAGAILDCASTTFYSERFIDFKKGPIRTIVGEATQGKILNMRLRTDARLLELSSLLEFAQQRHEQANQVYTEQEAVTYLLSTIAGWNDAGAMKRPAVHPDKLIGALHDKRTIAGTDGITYYSGTVLSNILQRFSPEVYQ